MRLSKSEENRKIGHRRPGTPKTGGRRPGSLNKRTIAVKEAVKFVAEQLGGPQAMLERVRKNDENEKIFWSVMFMKLLPVETNSHVTLTHEQALDELERRFPRFIDGKPVKYLEHLKAPHIETD